MKEIKDFIYGTSRQIASSIAFYPTLITLFFFFLALATLMIEYEEYMVSVRDFLEPVFVKTIEDARLILGTLVASIISLMVFSFSMVMIVLNRASSMLTPRVIPGLISKKSHQVVLGFDLGTIIYSLILIINIHPQEYDIRIPSIGILMAMIFGITSLAMFIYFIDNISRTIQTDNILQEIFRDTRQKMDSMSVEKSALEEIPDRSQWHHIHSTKTGYLKQLRINSLLGLAREHDFVLSLEENIGFFLVQNYPLLRINKEVDEEVTEAILDCFVFYTEEHVGDHYLFGFKQISEIAVKALSPGINDPGTAAKAIDLLSILFIEKINMHEQQFRKDNDDQVRVWLPGITLGDLLYNNLTPIREYGKNDPTILLKLLDMMINLAYADIHKRNHQKAISQFVESLVSSCRSYIDNELDRDMINSSIRRLSGLLDYDLQEIRGVADK